MPTTPTAIADTDRPHRPESVESLREQRDRMADFIRQLAADNPQTMALDSRMHSRALELIDSVPVPERCLNADEGAPDGGHSFVLPTGHGRRCLNCRTLRPHTPSS
ncbi:hypothetical protein ACIG3E_32725 [Streptomyces sp. NPDC053474]|uniref:hypothetical protein n=1 Tax=Streptomyces sp. NPDC053474 TaxID=3365704 RepID=UPI0037D56762